MPKKIAHLQEEILQDTRRILSNDGYEALTMRLVAADCSIAVGTLYNYYPSKEMLAGSAMLEDWLKCLARMKHQCAKAENLVEGLHILYRCISRFAGRYRSAWKGYAFCGSQQAAYSKRHRLLIEQTAACIAPLTSRILQQPPDDLNLFLAENVLACVNGSPMKFASFLQIAEAAAGPLRKQCINESK